MERRFTVVARSDTKREIRDRHVAWVEEVRRVTGKDLSSIARDAGLAANALTRFRNAGGEGALAPLTIKLISQSTGLPGPDELPEGEITLGEGRPVDLKALDKRLPRIAAAIRAYIGDSDTAEPWILNTRALEGAGYLRGDIVVVDSDLRPWAGRPVCAEIQDFERHTRETIFRIIQPPYLVAVSGDPALRQPFLIDESRGVRVVGAITANFRTEQGASPR